MLQTPFSSFSIWALLRCRCWRGMLSCEATQGCHASRDLARCRNFVPHYHPVAAKRAWELTELNAERVTAGIYYEEDGVEKERTNTGAHTIGNACCINCAIIAVGAHDEPTSSVATVDGAQMNQRRS